MIRVLLADDQELVRNGFRLILESEPGIRVVGEAADGLAAVHAAAELDPDVVCMDVQMPGMDGLEATRRIAGGGSETKVLVLTTFDRDDYLFSALDAGASGFLLKTVPPETLIEAVQVLARGDALLAPAVTRRVIDRAVRAPLPIDETAVNELTDRERDVIERIARGLSNAEIAAELFVGEATVKTHVSHMLQKLVLRDRVHLVIWAYTNGVVAH